MRKNRKLRTNLPDANPDRFQWDWVTFGVAVVIAVILGLITFDFWVSYGNSPHG